MAERHVPRSIRDDPGKAAAFLALQPGVPEHLHDSLVSWIGSVLPARYHANVHPDLFPRLTSIERALQLRLSGRDALGKRQGLFAVIDGDGELMLDVVDYMLQRHAEFEISTNSISILNAILDGGGSEWTVERLPGRRLRLARRVEPALQATLHEATTPADNAATHLSSAWVHAFGRNPSASSAYSEAVKALEAAFQPVAKPNDGKATLGRIVGELKATPEMFGARIKSDQGEGVAAVEAVLRNIWETQQRHGSSIPGTPTSETIEEARDAVVLAASLVQLVRQGGFARK